MSVGEAADSAETPAVLKARAVSDLFGLGGLFNTYGGNAGPGAGGGYGENGGGLGGFGGGGGAISSLSGAGNGGFGGGGGGGYAGVGGFGAGNGMIGADDVLTGGAGAGLGGAIFEYAGTLSLTNDTFTGNAAIGGTSSGNAGQGKGGAIFVYYGATASAANTSFSGSVAANAGQPGIGNSPAPYGTGAMCPGQDSADICGVLTSAVTVGTNVPGLAFTVDNSAAYTAAQTFTWTSGQQHTLTVSSPQSGGAGTQYAFMNWSDGASALSDTITVNASTPSLYRELPNAIPGDGERQPQCGRHRQRRRLLQCRLDARHHRDPRSQLPVHGLDRNRRQPEQRKHFRQRSHRATNGHRQFRA